MISVRKTSKYDDRLQRLLWLLEDYQRLMSKIGYFNPIWEIYMKKHTSIQAYIINNYKLK